MEIKNKIDYLWVLAKIAEDDGPGMSIDEVTEENQNRRV